MDGIQLSERRCNPGLYLEYLCVFVILRFIRVCAGARTFLAVGIGKKPQRYSPNGGEQFPQTKEDRMALLFYFYLQSLFAFPLSKASCSLL